MKKNKSYTVTVEVKLSTTVEVKAESFEDALAHAYQMTVTDVVTFDGDHNDSEIKVTGIFE